MGMARLIERERLGALLTMPGDIPGTTSAEVNAVVSACLPAPSFAIAPAHDELGSNTPCSARRPAACLCASATTAFSRI
jgi:CTP:molybdopterin cytidylyltransferase MocA